MATLDELSVLISAKLDASGFTKAEGALDGLTKSTQQASVGASAAFSQMGAAAETSATRYVDATGRLREANGRFVSTATLAAEAAGNVGGAFAGTGVKAQGLASTVNGPLAAAFASFDQKNEALNKGLGRLAGNITSTGQALTVGITLPLGLIGAAVVKVGGDFESAFNRVEASTQASGASLDALKDKAKAIAIDPKLKFSAVDAAGALDNLAKNGVSTTDILGGVADASVNLATATGGTLATAADITTDVLKNFNLSASQVAGSIDTITGASLNSKGSIEDYRQALAQSGAVAGQLGVNFKDFNTALAVTASGFSSGSDAGTSFKTFLQRLAPQSKEAAAAMKQLGLNFFDAQGKMLPLRDVAGQLQKAFSGLSDQAKNTFGTEIFGADSIRTALLLAKDGAEGFDKMAESIGKVKASSQGAILSQGFTGALEGFKSALEGLGIAIAESGVLDSATKLVKGAGELVSGLAQLDPGILRLITGFGLAAAAVGPVLFVVGKLGTALVGLEAGFAALGITSVAALAPILPVAAAVAAAAYLIIRNWDAITAYFGASGEGGKVFSELADSVQNAMNQIGSAFDLLSGGDGLDTLGGLASAASVAKDVFKDLAVGIGALADVIGGVIGTITELVKAFQELFAEGPKLGDHFTKAGQQAQRALFGVIDPLANLIGLTKKVELSGSFADAFRAAQDTGYGFDGAAGAVGDFSESLNPAKINTEAQTKALEKQLRALQDLDKGYDNIGSRTTKGLRPQDAPEFIEVARPKAPDLPTELQTLPGFDTTALGASSEAARQSYQLLTDSQKLAYQGTLDFNTSIGEAFDSLSSNIGPLLGDFAVQFGDAFGSLIVGTSSAGDALKGLFGGILQSIGGFMSSFGAQLIAIGIGKDILEKLFAAPGTGPLAIAAGIGLVALGGIASALGKSAASSVKGITSGGGGASLSSAPRTSFTPSVAPDAKANNTPAVITHNVIVTASGRDLAGTLQYQTDRLGRVIGG